MTQEPLKEVVEHQRKQIELLKRQLIETGQRRDDQEAWLRRHEKHLDEIRTKLTRIWEFLDFKKIEALKALDWLRTEADRNDYDMD